MYISVMMKKHSRRGFSLIGCMISISLLGVVTMSASQLLLGYKRTVVTAVKHGDQLDLKNYIRDYVSCNATIRSEGGNCLPGKPINLWQADCRRLVDQQGSVMGGYEVRASCEQLNGSYHFKVEAKHPKAQAYQQLFAKAPLVCEPSEYTYRLRRVHASIDQHRQACAAMGPGWALARVEETDELFHMMRFFLAQDVDRQLSHLPYIDNSCSDIMNRSDLPPNLCRGTLAYSPRCANKAAPEPTNCSAGSLVLAPWAWEWPHIDCPDGSLCLEDTTGKWSNPGYYGLCEYNPPDCSP